jgi:DNA-nicking Smr family endonuclease
MSRRNRKGLTQEDSELWGRVARTARPMHPEVRAKPARQAAKKEHKKPETPAFTIKPFEVGQRSAVATVVATQHKVSPIDKKTATRLKRGKLKPQARIDLHGMTQDQALPALTRFITDAAARELRLVLVITGKGRSRSDMGPIPERPGVLRRAVPHWLRSGMIAPLILDVTESHISHGGSGAYYVYLRRQRPG